MKSSNSHEIKLWPDETFDDFMDGRLKLIQSKTGYRFSIDAILLSEFVTIKQGDVVIDLGTGCGVIPLILLLTRSLKYVLGLEIQRGLSDQASRNARFNGFERRMKIILGDIKHPPFADSSADVVICNPPYRKKDHGRINPDPQRAIARHEIRTSLNDILSSARRLLRSKGRLAIIFPVVRLVDLLAGMRGFDLEPKRMRIVYPDLQSEAKLALVEASLGGQGGLKILPPIIDQGDFSI